MDKHKQYVLGVDGGNTKTDFVIADSQGVVVAALRGGTCSHEALPGSFAEAKQQLDGYISQLTQMAGLNRQQITSAAFGLAGVDTTAQQQKLEEIISALGFEQFVVANDSFLPIKAQSRLGYGIASINGTGTVVGAIAGDGSRLQVGGIGEITQDSGGGRHFAMLAIRAVYNEIFRCGPRTAMRTPMEEWLQLHHATDMLEAIRSRFLDDIDGALRPMQILFEACQQGDAVAREIVSEQATQLANSVVGCANFMGMEGAVPVVCAGSIWLKAETPLLYTVFCQVLDRGLAGRAQPVKLTAPPVCGAVHWALQRQKSGGYSYLDSLNQQVALSLQRQRHL